MMRFHDSHGDPRPISYVIALIVTCGASVLVAHAIVGAAAGGTFWEHHLWYEPRLFVPLAIAMIAGAWIFLDIHQIKEWNEQRKIRRRTRAEQRDEDRRERAARENKSLLMKRLSEALFLDDELVGNRRCSQRDAKKIEDIVNAVSFGRVKISSTDILCCDEHGRLDESRLSLPHNGLNKELDQLSNVMRLWAGENGLNGVRIECSGKDDELAALMKLGKSLGVETRIRTAFDFGVPFDDVL